MPRQINEDQTRKQMIDPQLEHAGWYLRDHSKVNVRGRQFKTIITHTTTTSSTQRLYEPLDMFGADAVERLFTEKEVEEIVSFSNQLSV